MYIHAKINIYYYYKYFIFYYIVLSIKNHIWPDKATQRDPANSRPPSGDRTLKFQFYRVRSRFPRWGRKGGTFEFGEPAPTPRANLIAAEASVARERARGSAPARRDARRARRCAIFNGIQLF